MNAAKCWNLFSFEFIFHFHVVLSQDADTGPIPPPRSVSNIESYFYCNCVVLFVSCECAFSLPTIIYGFRLFYWDWRPEKSAPSLAFSYELCFLSPVCRAVEITRSRLKHSAESFLCAWCLGEHYFLVDLIYRHERTGKRKAYANTRWRRDSWIKFLMKMFSAVCALNYRQRKTSWWGRVGLRVEGTKNIWLICFRRKFRSTKCFSRKTFRYSFYVCGKYWSSWNVEGWNFTRDCISLMANHQQPSNSFNHALEIVWKRAAASFKKQAKYPLTWASLDY